MPQLSLHLPRNHIGTAILWRCLCSCGNEKITRTDYLRNGRILSCGCARNTGPSHESVWNQVILKHSWQAFHRGIKNTLSDDHVLLLVKSVCHYCGASPSSRKTIKGVFVDMNGIDRVDSSTGYETGNVVPCCKRCNVAKNTMSYQEFKAWIKTAYDHLFKSGKKQKNPIDQLSL